MMKLNANKTQTNKSKKQQIKTKKIFLFLFWVREGLTLLLRISIKKNHGSCSSSLRIV